MIGKKQGGIKKIERKRAAKMCGWVWRMIESRKVFPPDSNSKKRRSARGHGGRASEVSTGKGLHRGRTGRTTKSNKNQVQRAIRGKKVSGENKRRKKIQEYKMGEVATAYRH